MALTGNKDTDYIILSKVDDRTLLSYCQTNQKAKQICDNEQFWRNRFISKFDNEEKYNANYSKLKSSEKSWKTFYLEIISTMNLDDPYNDLDRMRHSEYIDVVEYIMKTTLGNWDVFDFFGEYFGASGSRTVFLPNDVAEEIRRKLPETHEYDMQLLDEAFASFPILKFWLISINDPELTERVKNGIIDFNHMSSIQQQYAYRRDVQNFLGMVEGRYENLL